MKILGSILVIISSIVTAYFYEEHQKNKIKSLKELSAFIEYIKYQIEYFTLPLSDIYRQAENKNTYIEQLIEGKRINDFGEKLGDELSSCFNGLGKGFKAEQIKILEYTGEQINAEIKEQEKNYTQKVKVFRAMALFVGCCSVILFI